MALYEDYQNCNLNVTDKVEHLRVPTIHTRGCQEAYQEDLGALPEAVGGLTVFLSMLQVGEASLGLMLQN